MSKELFEEELIIFRETFKLFDKNNSGRISTTELGPLMIALGNQKPSKSALENMMKKIDNNGKK